MIEYWHLKDSNASFAESFYQLRRNPVVSDLKEEEGVLAQRKSKMDAKHLPLLTSDIAKSMIGLVLVPYLESKGEEWWERNGGAARAVGIEIVDTDTSDGVIEDAVRKEKQLNEALNVVGDDDASQRAFIRLQLIRLAISTRAKLMAPTITRGMLKLYPYIAAAVKLLTLAYQILYLYGKSRYYDPWTHLAGLEVRRMGIRDFKTQQDKEALSPNLFKLIPAMYNGQAVSSSQLMGGLKHLLAQMLQYGLPMSVFFLRFLEWWYASDYASSRGDKPIPPPPIAPAITNPMALEDAKKAQEDLWIRHREEVPPQMCPSCLKVLTNPTALPSGFVCCYPCAFKASEVGVCPLTGLPVEVSQLRKVYDVQA
jgi:peroxin-12